jgi:acetyl/propionyl-CoA carboxylase alpha subunit
MIAKLVVWDTDRTSALRRLNVSLNNYRVLPSPTLVACHVNTRALTGLSVCV